MDKYIDDKDRIIIGVREWAFQTVLSDPWCGQAWTEDRCYHSDEERVKKDRTTKQLLATAKELEEYILKGIKD